MAKILVEMDLTTGLPLELDIICHERIIQQRLDYLNLPFRCSIYSAVVHLRRTCPEFRKKNASPSSSPLSQAHDPSPSPNSRVIDVVEPSKGTLSQACYFFYDAIEQDLQFIDSVTAMSPSLGTTKLSSRAIVSAPNVTSSDLELTPSAPSVPIKDPGTPLRDSLPTPLPSSMVPSIFSESDFLDLPSSKPR